MVGEARYEEILFSRIHAPKVDDYGNVTKRGYIDPENLPTFYDLYKVRIRYQFRKLYFLAYGSYICSIAQPMVKDQPSIRILTIHQAYAIIDV